MISKVTRPRLVIFLLIAAAEFGCQKKAAGPPPRYAFVRFENLSGDPSLEWTGRAAGELLPISLANALDGPVLNEEGIQRLASALGVRPAATPGISSERAQAILAGANHIFSGYVERVNGAFRVATTEEDVSTGKSLRIVSAEDASFLATLAKLARELSPAARPFLSKNEEAVRLLATGLETPRDKAKEYLEQAARLDPAFGPAWVALASVNIAGGDRNRASSVIDEARQQKLDSLTVANLEVLDAALKGEPLTARIAAERKLADLSPADTVLLRSLAQRETEAGEFAAAAADWKKLTEWLPGDPEGWNFLGYARSYAGDYAGALAALREYARLRPADANPFDSIGDLYYSFRKFSEAAASYQQASAKEPAFQNYVDLYKASWAKFSAGDHAGADALFAKFRAAREKANDALIPLLAADWLYRTGRPAEGVTMLRQAVGSTPQAALRTDGYVQLVVWDLLAGDRLKASEDAAAAGPATSSPVVFARFAALPSATAAEWESRANRMLADPSVASLRPFALGYALLLDGKREAAAFAWQEIAKQSRATDFFFRAIATRLQGKPYDRPVVPEPSAFNPFAALLDKL